MNGNVYLFVVPMTLPGSRLGASTGQKYSSTSTSTWKYDEYKYKYWIFKSTWVQVQEL